MRRRASGTPAGRDTPTDDLDLDLDLEIVNHVNANGGVTASTFELRDVCQ